MQLQDQLSELVIELAEVANEQLVLVVVDLMPVGDRLLLDGVIVWDDVPELNEVQQRKGELGQVKSDPTCRYLQTKDLLCRWPLFRAPRPIH